MCELSVPLDCTNPRARRLRREEFKNVRRSRLFRPSRDAPPKRLYRHGIFNTPNHGVWLAVRVASQCAQPEYRPGLPAPVQTAPGSHPASCTMGTGSFPWVKQPGRGVDHPPPSRAEVKESRVIALLPVWPFVACSRVNFTFYLYLLRGVVSKLRAGRSGVRIPVGPRDFLVSKACRLTVSPTHPRIQWVPGLFPGVNRPGREGDHISI